MKSIFRIVFLIVASVVLLSVFYLILDYRKHRTRTVQCDDGERQTIDFKELQIEYSSKKISLDIEVIDKLRIRHEIDPKVLQIAFESTQNWDQFLKGLIGGYNSCAVSKANYALMLQRYKGMEDISRSLSQLFKKNRLTHQDVEMAEQLIKQYSSISQELFAGTYTK
jgi:hypothetical protein